MNLYIFRNELLEGQFREWLRDNCFRRFGVIEHIDALFGGRRQFAERFWQGSYHSSAFHDQRKRRSFHSQRRCNDGGWSKCCYSRSYLTTVRGKAEKQRTFHSKFKFTCRSAGERYPISVVFDEVTDLVHCKLRWEDDNFHEG